MSGSVPSIARKRDDPVGGWSGWKPWIECPPYAHAVVEAWRYEWQKSEIIEPMRMHPAMNVAGLYWKPVADGGEAVN
jgi:hypothetical protein